MKIRNKKELENRILELEKRVGVFEILYENLKGKSIFLMDKDNIFTSPNLTYKEPKTPKTPKEILPHNIRIRGQKNHSKNTP